MSAASFAPKDFGKAIWHGGPATITDAYFKYRTFTPEKGEYAGQEFKTAMLQLEYTTPEGATQQGRYDVGAAKFCQIKAGPEDGADAVEQGPSIANSDPSMVYKIRPDSELGEFVSSLVNGGFDESKLLSKDIGDIIGTDVEIYEKPRRDGDKFPLRLVKPASVKMKATGKAAAQKAAASGVDPKEVATEFILRFTAESGNETSQASLARNGINDDTIKSSGVRGAVIPLFNNKTFLESSDLWSYDPVDKVIRLVG